MKYIDKDTTFSTLSNLLQNQEMTCFNCKLRNDTICLCSSIKKKNDEFVIPEFDFFCKFWIKKD